MDTDRPAPSPRQLLELAGRWYRGAGAREQAVRVELNMSAVQFWAAVNRVVDAPPPEVALEFGPLLNRLRRQREAGMRARSSRRAG
jgi:hypothetical protein